MAKILITGGAGYIGSVLVREFLSQGHVVIVLDTLERGSDGLPDYRTKRNFSLINADFTTRILDFALQDIDVVIHLAALSGDPACDAEPERATKVNVEGIRFLVETCNNYDLKLFFASTCSVYGSNAKTCHETTKLNPLSHYAKTKIEAENIIRENSENGISFRFATMYGWSPNIRYDLVVNRLVYDAVNKNEFKIFGGEQFRPFLHPLDLAYFWSSLFDKDLSSYVGEVFNLVSENLSMLELGQLIERTIPYSKMNRIEDAVDKRSYICRMFKAYKDLSFQPKIRVRDGIQEIERELIKSQNPTIEHPSLRV